MAIIDFLTQLEEEIDVRRFSFGSALQPHN